MTDAPAPGTDPMREFWDREAADDAYHAVMTEKRGWDRAEYERTGERHVGDLLLPFLARQGVSPERMRSMAVLDLGCGTGRMAMHLADLFGSVTGTDVSPEMIRVAERDHAGKGIRFLATNGADLREIPDASVDVAFSYATLQHVSPRAAVLSNLREVHRVLIPGGLARIEVRGEPGNLPGRLLWFRGFERFALVFVLWRGLVPLLWIRRYDPVYGAAFTEGELRSELTRIGFEVLSTSLEGRRHLWAELRKR